MSNNRSKERNKMEVNKISWGAISILILIGVAFSTLDLLITPALLSYTQAKEWSAWVFGLITTTTAVAAIVSSRIHTFMVNRWGLKRVLLGVTIAWMLASILRFTALDNDHWFLFTLAGALSAGCGTLANLSVSLQLQEEAKGKQMLIMAVRVVIASLCSAGFAALSAGFPAMIKLWSAIHAAGLLVCCLLIVAMWRRLLDDQDIVQQEKQRLVRRLRGWFQRDYVQIYVPQLCFLFVVQAMVPLLPVLERGAGHAPAPMSGTMAGVMYVVMIVQLVLALLIYEYNKASTWVMIGTRVLALVSLPLIVWGIASEQMTVVILGAAVWGIANCNRPISRAIVRERNWRLQHDLSYRAAANALPTLLWHSVNLAVPVYYGFFSIDKQVGAEKALWWMMVPLGITMILTLVVWKAYVLPPVMKEE